MSYITYALEITSPSTCYLKGDSDVAYVALNNNVIRQKLAKNFNHYTMAVISLPLGYEMFQRCGTKAVDSLGLQSK
jgi:hypothetical protein